MNTNLNGKRALVAGSTQGIGRAAAMQLAALGAHVTLLARNEATLVATQLALPTPAAQQHHYIVADTSQPETLAQRVADYLQAQGPLHIWVNNTGGPPGGPILQAAVKEFYAALAHHLEVGQRLAQLLVPGMQTAGYGRIVNVISTSVKQPIPNLGVSNTTRWAVAAWAKTLAGEVARHGITVNNVLPGYTRTERLNSLVQTNASKTGRELAEVEAGYLRDIPAGRFGEADEVAAAIAFLASPAASYITGINLPVDGGRLSCL